MKKDSRRTLFFLLFINRGFTNLEGVCSFFFATWGGNWFSRFPRFRRHRSGSENPALSKLLSLLSSPPRFLPLILSHSPYIRVEGKNGVRRSSPHVQNDNTVRMERGRLCLRSPVHKGLRLAISSLPQISLNLSFQSDGGQNMFWIFLVFQFH